MAGAGVWKWRLVYDREGIRECTCTPYVMRRVERLRLVSDDTIDYAYKRANRSALEVVPWSFDGAIKHVLGEQYNIDDLWHEYQVAVGDIKE